MDKLSFLQQNDNLKNYYFFKNTFDSDEINKILEISKKYDTIDANVSNKIDYSYRKTKIKWLPYNDETEFIYKKLFEMIKIANKEMWNFNITNFKESLQLGEYNDEEQGHYDWHMDFGVKNSSTRKLSVSVQLSDPEEYEGGELNFHIYRDIIKAPNSKGTVIIFPSYILHRVTPVTKGCRRSLVCWIHGPSFV